MKTRNGKIARLLREVREELNQRLDNGQTERVILPWLNAVPAVKEVLADEFDDSPVNQQNLTNWRQGGYEEWLKEQAHSRLVRDAVRDARDLASLPNAPGLADTMSTVLMAHLLVSAKDTQQEIADPAERCEWLRGLLQTVGEARREDYMMGRLALDRDRQVLAMEIENCQMLQKQGGTRLDKVNQAQTRP